MQFIDTKLINFIKNSADKNGVTIKITDSIPSDALELKVEITDSISAGNAFIGHRKFTSISENLTQTDTTIGTFEVARCSGGAFGGFKGSCATLGRTRLLMLENGFLNLLLVLHLEILV